MTEPPEIEIPARDWGDDEEPAELPPLVLVSSRDGRGDPGEPISNRSAAWRGLSKRAAKAGWTVTVTYALAWKAEVVFSTGRVKKGAHHVHTIALRLVRDGVRAWAIWRAESRMPDVPAAGWSFSVAALGRGVTGSKDAWIAAVLPS
jgi:hypothetical protein